MNGLIKTRMRTIVVFLTIMGLGGPAAWAAPGILTNGVPVTGLLGSAGSELFYAITVPSGQDELEIRISGGSGDCDLYVRLGSEPTTTDYDYRPYKVGNDETVTIPSPTAGTWYVMLRGYSAYSGVTLLATYSASVSVTPLDNGLPVTGLSGAGSSEQYFRLEVPAGQSELEIAISGGSGDCDLYVKLGSLPTTSDYDYRPFLVGNDETVTVDSPTAGTWYIMLRGYSAFSGVTLVGTYSGGVGIMLKSGLPVTDLSGTLDSEKIFRIDVPADQKSLDILMTNGIGDCDLYVKFGAPPTTSDWDYRPYLANEDEEVTVADPTPGSWYIMLYGGTAYSDVTLVASYDDVVLLEDNVPVPGLAGALDSEQFFKIKVPSGKNKLQITITGGVGNCDLYVRYGEKPTQDDWDYGVFLPGNEETITIDKPDPGFWYIMLHAREAYTGVTLTADYWFSGTVTLLTNGVPKTGLADSEDGEKYFRIIVPSGQEQLTFSISGGTGDADLYVKYDAVPTTKEWDYRPYLIGNDETVTIDEPASGDWLVMIRAHQDYSGVTLVATYGSKTEPDKVTPLTNGVPVTDLSGGADSEVFFKIDVPAGQDRLEIAISGGTGDVDLYVRVGELPTETEWDYRPYLIGNDETVSIDDPEAGTYYIMLRAYVAYTDVTLVATYEQVAETVKTLKSGFPEVDLAAPAGTETFYKIDVPAGQDFLNIAIFDGTGDCDLYVRKGALPTTSSYDYRPYLVGNDEMVEVLNPAAATWYIMLRASEAYTGVTLLATYAGVGTGNVFSEDPDCVALWRFEPGELTVDSIGSNTLSNDGAQSYVSDPQEGSGAAAFSATDGDSMSIFDDDLSLDFPTRSTDTDVEMSICFWMRPDSFSYENTIISKYLIATDARSWRILVSNRLLTTGILKIGLGTGDGSTFDTYKFDEPEQELNLDHWYHVAFTYRDADKSYHVRVYDATAGAMLFDVEGTVMYPIAVGDAPIMIGNLPLQTRYFDGVLDEMVVFKDILTTDEIDQIRQGSYGSGK